MKSARTDEPVLDVLRRTIEHAAHRLPSQGPIRVFVHHNTLHPFESLPFDEAMRVGAVTYGCETYLAEDRYRREVAKGRITAADLEAVLGDDLDERGDEILIFNDSRYQLRRAMLLTPLRIAPDAKLHWLMAETETLEQFPEEMPSYLRQRLMDSFRHWVLRDILSSASAGEPSSQERRPQAALEDLLNHFGRSQTEQWPTATWEELYLKALWRACHQGVHGITGAATAMAVPLRPRELLFQATGQDADLPVHDLLIRFCGAFLDQGLAEWTLPDVQEGFFTSFSRLYRMPGGVPTRFAREVRRELQRIHEAGLSPLESIEESLLLLDIAPNDTEEFLSQTLLALRGWAGMIWQMETNAEWTVRPAPAGTLIEYLAIRLILDRVSAVQVLKEEFGESAALSEWKKLPLSRRASQTGMTLEQRAFLVFQLALSRGWLPQELFHLPKADWGKLVREIEAFDGLERRRIFHAAYERNYFRQALDAVAIASRGRKEKDETPLFQLSTCIDDREESYRRHLEEIEPRCETFGGVGFYAAAMYYRGAGEAHFLPLCPVIIKPQHYVTENVDQSVADLHERRAKVRRVLGSATHWFHTGSRSFLSGAATSLVGAFATLPMVTRILFPRLTAKVRTQFSRAVQPPPKTQLCLERRGETPSPQAEGIGYSLEEMAGIVSRMLEDIGLTRRFARIVVLTGHGSSSLNNPHESAYNCGACGGGRGGPNARAFAQMANDRRVRELLIQKGLHIPDVTVFVGCYHNTCDDSVTWFDLERIPESHRQEFKTVRAVIDQARERNAQERCRRFESAPFTLTPSEALEHVEERSEDLSQARPEYNHATNAVTIVGRRYRQLGLYCDRRAFLQSYDPLQDPDGSILARVLSAVIPVCAGISLEYYFSSVDVTSLGCGSKLPHNVASLIGVMEGALSDLRTGLSQQMIEIHEPMRPLFIIETTPEIMQKVMAGHPGIERLCRGDWVQIAVLDPHSDRIDLLRNGRFERYRPSSNSLPTAASSQEWFRGWRDHLGFALIGRQESDDSPSPGPTHSWQPEEVRS